VKVLVVGIGHSLRGDDAAGLEAVRAWQRGFPVTAARSALRVELLESPMIELASVLQGAEAALLVDAVCSGTGAGKLHRLGEGEIPAMHSTSGPVHGWGIPEALQMARALGFHPQAGKLRLLGIEAAQMDIGAALSPEVRGVLGTAAAAIEDEIQTLMAG
jgi:hydrogenase maturation protease